MSEQSAPEPTMEEILASIRRIISEDDPPAGDAEADGEATAEAAEAAEEPDEIVDATPDTVEAEIDVEDDVLELTEKVEAEVPNETVGDLDVFDRVEPEPEPEPVAAAAPPTPAPKPAAPAMDDGLVGEPAAVAAASAFGKLSAAVQMPTEGRTLEDVTRELLRPLLKTWLDENLPAIVKAKVEEEVERIARSRVR